MKMYGALTIAVVAIIAFGSMIYIIQPNESTPAEATHTTSVSPAVFAQKMTEKDRHLIDIRTPEEFAEGHLEGARNIDFYNADFQKYIDTLDRDAPYAIYCRSGNRTGQTLALMQSLGFTDVVDLRGGLIAWEANNQSTCTDAVC